jgi:lysozyme
MINAVIDLSHHNQVTSFEAVKEAGILAVILKATQGATYVDPTFASNRQLALQAGLLVGAYHFGIAGEPDAQAEKLISVAGAESLLVLDFESNPQGQSMSLVEAEQFVHHVNALTGRYPGLYSGHDIKDALSKAGITDPSQTELSRCWFWLSQYGSSPMVPKIWKSWTLWQYTDGGQGPGPYTVDGVGRCDRDQFAGTAEELAALFAPAPGPAAVAAG